MLDLGRIGKEAQARLAELQLDDTVDQLVSLGIEIILRIVGILDGSVLQLPWWNPNQSLPHGFWNAIDFHVRLSGY